MPGHSEIIVSPFHDPGPLEMVRIQHVRKIWVTGGKKLKAAKKGMMGLGRSDPFIIFKLGKSWAKVEPFPKKLGKIPDEYSRPATKTRRPPPNFLPTFTMLLFNVFNFQATFEMLPTLIFSG